MFLLFLFGKSKPSSSKEDSSTVHRRLRRDHSHSREATTTTSTTTSNKTIDTAVGWKFAGPTTYVNQFGDDGDDDDDDDSPRLASAGAVQNVVEGFPGTWFLGSVNGGVWRTRTLHTTRPHWEPVLDGNPNVTCTSISAMHVYSPLRQRKKQEEEGVLVYAGCGGSTSSEQGSDWNVVNSGEWTGVMVSKDNGETWDMLPGFPPNYYVTDILHVEVGPTLHHDVDGDASSSVLLVSAQSHLFDRNDGGIWRSMDQGRSFEKVDSTPTFTLTPILSEEKISGVVVDKILATHARNRSRSVSVSKNNGLSFEACGVLPWNEEDQPVPFYTCSTVLGDGRIVVAGLTRLHGGLPNNTDSQFFIQAKKTRKRHPDDNLTKNNDNENSDDDPFEWVSFSQPTRMDEDSMPKDRMALLADPLLDDLLYVAGNAGALAWRVNLTTMVWTKLWDKPDVIDGSIPHGDCRNYAWDSSNNRLLLVSDGGIFAREQPRAPGGKWVSLNGDYSSLELLSAHFDPKDQRYVMGAQDNCAIVTKPNATAKDVGFGFVEGDGAITLVDSVATPSRLFGTTQFLGVGTIYRDPTRLLETDTDDDDDDDDDDCGGLCFVQGDRFIKIPVDDYFPEPSTFPNFVHPYTLNAADPTLLHFWTNGVGTYRQSAFYEFELPYSIKDTKEIAPPRKLVETPDDEMILDFVSGGNREGNLQKDILIAVSNAHLYIYQKENGDFGATEKPLPVRFANPVSLEYDMSTGERILGPLTHARTVSISVSKTDYNIIALTGWQSIDTNPSEESIFVTTDAGSTWTDVTGNLRQASGVTGIVRPNGVELVDLDEGNRALLVGTSTGVMATLLDKPIASSPFAPFNQHTWVRLGGRDEFPLVLTADVDYELDSDTLVVATFGRGIYILDNAKSKLTEALGKYLQQS